MGPSIAIPKAQFENEIKLFFEQKISISKGKKVVIAQMKKDEYDNSISVSNVRLLYTSNSNFNGGKQNNGGAGWYLTNGHDQFKVN